MLSVPTVIIIKKAEGRVIFLFNLARNHIIVRQANFNPFISVILDICSKIIYSVIVVQASGTLLFSFGFCRRVNGTFYLRCFNFNITLVKQPIFIKKNFFSHNFFSLFVCFNYNCFIKKVNKFIDFL